MEEFRPRKRRLTRKRPPGRKLKVLLGWMLSGYLRPYFPLLLLTVIVMGLAAAFTAAPLVLVNEALEVILTEPGNYKSEALVDNRKSETYAASDRRAKSKADLKVLKKETLDKFRKPLTDVLVRYGKRDPFKVLALISILMVVACSLKALFTFLKDFLMKYVTEGVTRRLRENVYCHILKLPLSFFTGSGTGKLMSYINNDVVLAKDVVNVLFDRVIYQPMQISALLTYAAMLNWRLTGLFLIVIPFCAVVVSTVGKKLRRAKSKSQKQLSDLNAILHETFSAVRIVRAFRMEEYEKRRFEEKATRIFQIATKMARVRAGAGPAVEWLGTVGVSVILLLGGYFILIRRSMDGTDFLTFVAALVGMYGPLKSLAKANAEFQEGLAGVERVHEILNTEIEVKDDPACEVLPALEREIKFDHVFFHYKVGADAALADVSFNVKRGQTIALVGHSGAGKSTAMDLLMRFYDVTDGAITIDGRNIRDVRLSSLREQIGFVPQDVILFNDTIRNNIAYGCQNPSQERVEEAARLANAHDFIASFQDGYETMVGERGAQLSGGQAQRISIARALFKDPEILIFDEATSSLDSESEMLIRKAMENLIKDRTTFIIAHRLSTVLHADQIIVLNQGQVAGVGKHDELMANNVIYRRLYNLQFRPSHEESMVDSTEDEVFIA